MMPKTTVIREAFNAQRLDAVAQQHSFTSTGTASTA
jgi:hypothetical protein